MHDLHAIKVISEQLHQSRHVAVGASSPIPAAAALLAKKKNPHLRVSLLGDASQSSFTDGGKELFDCAAQGRIDTFFLSGVQIDGDANINLVGIGEYPQLRHRFAGSFGSAYLYHLVPNIILFCWSHSPKVLVNRVDFISAAGPRDSLEYRKGGPVALVTNRCVFCYRAEQKKFELRQTMPGETQRSIAENTGFEFDIAAQGVREVATMEQDSLDYLRGDVSEQMQLSYPRFAAKLAATTNSAMDPI